MENLPTPLSRVELYLAKACGMDVTVPEQPLSRLEQFLAILAGDTSITMPAPMSLTEQWLAYVLGVTPDPLLAVEGAHLIGAQKVDVRYFAVAAGMPGATLPEAPQNRAEMYWAYIAINPPSPGVLKYVTGSNITLTDVKSTKLESAQVNGNTFQQTYSGKNLFGAGTIASYTYCTATISNNIITVTPTGTGNPQIRLNLLKPLPAGTYTLNSTTYLSVATILSGSDNTSVYNMGANYSEVTFTSTAEAVRITFNFANPNNTNPFTVDLTTLQIEAGSTATSYEPFVGGTPSPSPDYPQPINVVTGEQTVTVSGKNLFNADYYKDAAYTTGTYKYTKTDFKGGETYTFTAQLKSGKTAISGLYVYISTASNPNSAPESQRMAAIYNGSTATRTSSIPSGATLYFQFYPATTDITQLFDTYNFQLEFGSTATEYTPFAGYENYTIDLGSIELAKIGNYQDYIYKSGDDWYVHKVIKKMIFDGSSDENWDNLQSTKLFRIRVTDLIGQDDGAVLGPILSNYYISTAYNNLSNSQSIVDYGVALRATSANGVGIKNIDVTNVAGFKTWLSNNNTIVYAPLATPTDTKITDSTLISQLNALAGATLYKGTTYITVGATSTNLPAELKIGYYGEAE